MTELQTKGSPTFPVIHTSSKTQIFHTTPGTSATHDTPADEVKEHLASHFPSNERTSSTAVPPRPLSSSLLPRRSDPLPFYSSFLKSSASYPATSERKIVSVADESSSHKAVRAQEAGKPSAFPLATPLSSTALRQTKSTSSVPIPSGEVFSRLSTSAVASSPAIRYPPERMKSLPRTSVGRGSRLDSTTDNNVARRYDSTLINSMETLSKERKSPSRHLFHASLSAPPSSFIHERTQMRKTSPSVWNDALQRGSRLSASTFSEQEIEHRHRSLSSCSVEKDTNEDEGSTALLVVAGSPRPSHFTALHAAREAYQQLTADHAMVWDKVVEQQQRQAKIKSVLRYSLQPAVFQVKAEWKLMKSSAMYAFEAYRGYFSTYHDLLRQLMVQLLEDADEEGRGVVGGEEEKRSEWEKLDLRRIETYNDGCVRFRSRPMHLSSRTNQRFPTWDLLPERPLEEKRALQHPKTADGVRDNHSSSRVDGTDKAENSEEKREKKLERRSDSKRDAFKRRKGSGETRRSASTNSSFISSSSSSSTVTVITPPALSPIPQSNDAIFNQFSRCKNVDGVTPESMKEATSRNSTVSSLPSVSSARTASVDSFSSPNAVKEETKATTLLLNESQEKNDKEVLVEPSREGFLNVSAFDIQALQDQLAQAQLALVKLSQTQEKEKQFFQESVHHLHCLYAVREQRMRDDMLLFRQDNRQNEGEVRYCRNNGSDRTQKNSDRAEVESREMNCNAGCSRTETNGERKMCDDEYGKEVKESKRSSATRMPGSAAFSVPLHSSSLLPTWSERDTLWKQAVEETIRQEKEILTSTRPVTPVRGRRSSTSTKREAPPRDSNSIRNSIVLPSPDYYSNRCQTFFSHAAERLAAQLRKAEKGTRYPQEGTQSVKEEHHPSPLKTHSCLDGTRDSFLRLSQQNDSEKAPLKSVETEKMESCTKGNGRILSTDFPHNDQVNRVIAQGMWAEQLLLERNLLRRT